MTNIYVYIPSGSSVNREDIEEAIEDCLGERGDFTGSGEGAFGINIDMSVLQRLDVDQVVCDLRALLIRHNAPPQTQILIDGDTQTLSASQE